MRFEELHNPQPTQILGGELSERESVWCIGMVVSFDRIISTENNKHYG